MFKSKTTVKKIVSLLLALTFVLSCAVVLSSCSTPEESGSSSSNPTTPPTTEEEPDYPEKMDVNYNGYEFNVLVSNRATNTPMDFAVNEGDESALAMAVMKRNLAMEEKYGVKVVAEHDFSTSHKAIEKFEKQYTSQDNTYDLGVINTYSVAPLTTSGMLQDLNTVPYLDLSKSWWDQTIVEDLTIQDSIFYVCGDISTAVDDFMYCTVFNKELYKQKVTDGTDVYALVNEGKWTLDQLLRLSKLVQEDVNGDGVMDANDKFGLMTWYDELYASVQAAGGRVAQVNEQGNIELCINNARNLDVMVKYMELENSPSTINFQNTSKMVNGAKWSTMFTNDQVLFLMYTLNKLSILRNADTDYGILPNPKYNDLQENWYCTFSAGLAAFVCISAYQENLERTGIITELLGYEGTSTIKDGYYEKTLKGTQVRDDESIDSLGVILDNKFVDVGHYYRIGGLNTVLYNVAASGNAGSFASLYTAAEATAKQDIENINAQFNALKNKG